MAVVDISLVLTGINRAHMAMRQVKADLDNISFSAKATATRLKAIQVVFAGIAIAKATQLATSFIQTSEAIDDMRFKLALAVGGWEKAGTIIDDINKRFEGTKASADEVVKSVMVLSQVGMPVADAQKLADAIGQVAIGSGRTQEAISSVTLAFARLAEKGEVDVRTLVNSLTQSVPEAVNVMAAQAGKTVTQFVEDVKSGSITAQEAIELFVKGANARFAGVIAAQQNMLTGAIALMKNSWTDAIRKLQNETPINAEIVVRLQSMRKAIDELVARIRPEHVRDFFIALDRVGSAAQQVGNSLMPLIGIVAQFGVQLSTLITSLPPAVITAGIIGYLFAGRVGMVVVATIVGGFNKVLGEVEGNTRGFIQFVEDSLPLGILGLIVGGPKGAAMAVAAASLLNALATQLAVQGERFVNSVAGTSSTAIQDAAAAGKTAFGEFFSMLGLGTEKTQNTARTSSQAVEQFYRDSLKSVDELAAKQKELAAGTGDIRTTRQFQERMATAWNAVADKIAIAKDNLDQYRAVLQGSTLGKELGEIEKKYDQQVRSLHEALKAAQAYNNQYKTGGGLIADINKLIEESARLRGLEYDRAFLLYSLQQKSLLLEQSINQARAQQSLLTLRSENDNGVLSNVLRGATGGANEAALTKQLELRASIAEWQQKINELEEKKLNTNDPALIANLEKTKTIYEEVIRVSQNALQNTSAVATLNQQLWQGIGQTIQSGLTDAVVGLVTHMKSLKDVGIAVFNAITQAAANYLVKLMLIKAAEAFTGMPGAGTVAAFPMAMGGAFNGKVKPFANGDIIRGPTLFGLAGEAGTEAIMPLERIGGKLGVRTTGGGDQIGIHINAIDTQSGVEFLMKNMPQIQMQLAHRKNLNRGTRGVN